MAKLEKYFTFRARSTAAWRATTRASCRPTSRGSARPHSTTATRKLPSRSFWNRKLFYLTTMRLGYSTDMWDIRVLMNVQCDGEYLCDWDNVQQIAQDYLPVKTSGRNNLQFCSDIWLHVLHREDVWGKSVD